MLYYERDKFPHFLKYLRISFCSISKLSESEECRSSFAPSATDSLSVYVVVQSEIDLVNWIEIAIGNG